MSVRLLAWNNSAPTGRIFMKFEIWVFFADLSTKFKFHSNRTRITDLRTFTIISRSFLLMRNVSGPSCRENQNTHFMFNTFFPKWFRLWDNVEKYVRAGQATDNNTAHARYMLDNSGLHTHSQNMQYLSLFHCNSGYTNAPHYVTHKLPVLFVLWSSHYVLLRLV